MNEKKTTQEKLTQPSFFSPFFVFFLHLYVCNTIYK